MTDDFCCFELESTEEEDEGFVYEDDFRIMSILRPSSNSISVTPQPIWANRKVRFGKFYYKLQIGDIKSEIGGLAWIKIQTSLVKKCLLTQSYNMQAIDDT